MSCDSCCVIYFLTCSSCRDQYVGSAIKFKQIFRIDKSDIKIKNDRCGTARHFNNNCCSANNKHTYLKVRSLNKDLIIISVVLKICYGKEKNIGRHDYLRTCLEWIILMIYIVWKGKAIENNCFWTDVWHF